MNILDPDAWRLDWLRIPFSAEDGANADDAMNVETEDERQARLDAEMADHELDIAERERAEQEGKSEDLEAHEKAKMDHLAMCQRMWQEREAALKSEAEQRAALRAQRLESAKQDRALKRSAALKAGVHIFD